MELVWTTFTQHAIRQMVAAKKLDSVCVLKTRTTTISAAAAAAQVKSEINFHYYWCHSNGHTAQTFEKQ